MRIKDFFTDDVLFFGVDWDYISKQPQFQALAKTPQSKVWHQEGDVLAHTKLVVSAVLDIFHGQNPTRWVNFNTLPLGMDILIVAAICHDLGKATTTRWDNEKKDYTTAYHGSAGERIARDLLFDEPDIVARECICHMVRHHMTMHHLDNIEFEDAVSRCMDMIHPIVPLQAMAILNYADSKGSINEIEDDEFLRRKIKYVEKCCKEAEKRYYEQQKKLPEKEIIMMVGIPGSGKDTYIDKHFRHDDRYTVICRDDIRTEIGLKGDKPMGNKEQEDYVTTVFNKRLDDAMWKGKIPVINNTNLLRKYRRGFVDLLRNHGFNFKVRCIYIEPPTIDTAIKRRDGQIPIKVINRMWANFEFPMSCEYQTLEIQKQKKDGITTTNAILEHHTKTTSLLRKIKAWFGFY